MTEGELALRQQVETWAAYNGLAPYGFKVKMAAFMAMIASVDMNSDSGTKQRSVITYPVQGKNYNYEVSVKRIEKGKRLGFLRRLLK